jgi:hypothetical protein
MENRLDPAAADPPDSGRSHAYPADGPSACGFRVEGRGSLPPG